MSSVGVGVPDAQVSIYMKSEEGCFGECVICRLSSESARNLVVS